MDEAVGSNPTEGSNDKFEDLTLFPQGAIAVARRTRATGLSGVGCQGRHSFQVPYTRGSTKIFMERKW